jgi:hypothetical protein
MIFAVMAAAVIIGLFLYFTLDPIDNVYRHGHVTARWSRELGNGILPSSYPANWIKVEGVDFEGNPARDFHDTDANYDGYKIGDAYPR